MSKKVKFLTALCATIMFFVIGASSVFAATSATVGISATVSFHATNFNGTVYATVSGLGTYNAGNPPTYTDPSTGWTACTTGDVTNQNYYSSVTPCAILSTTTLPTWTISGKNIIVTNGTPAIVTFTYFITNEITENAKVILSTYTDADIPVCRYDNTNFNLTVKKVNGNSDLTNSTNYTTVTDVNWEDGTEITIPKNDGTADGMLKLVLEFKVKNPGGLAITNASLNFNLLIERM